MTSLTSHLFEQTRKNGASNYKIQKRHVLSCFRGHKAYSKNGRDY